MMKFLRTGAALLFCLAALAGCSREIRTPVTVMVAAGEGIVPWQETKRLLDLHGVSPLYIVHFEYDFNKTNLPKTVKDELDVFKRLFA